MSRYPKTDSLQGSLDLLVLKILSRRPRLHGYAIMTAIQDISGEVLGGPKRVRSIRRCTGWRKPDGCARAGSPKNLVGGPPLRGGI
jgi:hypothetical protein